MPTVNSNEYITIPCAAKRAQVTTRTLRSWVASGLLPAYRIGPRVLRIMVADLEAIIKPVNSGATGQDAESSIEAAIQRAVDTAPPLTDEQVARITLILRGGGAVAPQ